MNRIILFLVGILGVFTVQAQIVASKEGDNGKKGFIDSKGSWVVSPIYYWTHWYADDEYGTFNEISFEKKGAVDKWGKVIIPCNYSNINFYAGRCYIEQRVNGVELKGVYDIENGCELIPCKYSDVLFYGKVYKVTQETNGTYFEGICDIKGRELIPPIFNNIYTDKDVFSVTKGIYKGCYDKEGNVLIAPNKYTFLSNLNDGCYIFASKNGVGICDEKGHEVLSVPNKYDAIEYAGEGVFRVRTGALKNERGILAGGKWGYYSKGREIIPCKYDMVSVFNSGIATVKKDGQVILIKNPILEDSRVNITEGVTLLNNKKKPGLVTSRYPAPQSDVDNSIPISSTSENNLFAFIIANENYPDSPVPFALNDGRIFKEYCLKTLGIPVKNIRMFEDATYGNIIAAVEQMKQIADAFDGEAEAIIYYAGHGVPDEKHNSAYLLPIDGNPSDIASTGYSLEHFYSELSQMKLKNVTVFLDACFSGAKREDEMLLTGRGVAIKVKEESPKGNMVVFSAATGDETAHQLEDKGHGLFTYFLLKKLQETKGEVALGELAEYVTKQVKRQSVVVNNKKQTPTVIPSALMVDKWKTKPLK